MAGGRGTGRALLSLSFPFRSSALLFSRLFSSSRLPFRHIRALSLSATITAFAAPIATADNSIQPLCHSILPERIRSCYLKEAASASDANGSPTKRAANELSDGGEKGKKVGVLVSTFKNLGPSEEVMGALKETRISVPTETQCTGVPAVLAGKSVVLGLHTGSGKKLAYMLPLVQHLRNDEELCEETMKPRCAHTIVFVLKESFVSRSFFSSQVALELVIHYEGKVANLVAKKDALLAARIESHLEKRGMVVLGEMLPISTTIPSEGKRVREFHIPTRGKAFLPQLGEA